MTPELTCRLCHSSLSETFVDLGMSPLANSYIAPGRDNEPEQYYPLHARVCGQCFLVQLPELVAPREIFRDYRYLSSITKSWLRHARDYAEEAIAQFELTPSSMVVEIGSNDGYLLQFFKAHNIPVLGIEPAETVAAIAKEKRIETEVIFFSAVAAQRLTQRGQLADLIVANNVMAHVPDLNDFVAGMKRLLARGGTITIEVPHLLQLIAGRQFDTIYHEHFSYFSLRVVEKLFARHGLQVIDVVELSTHGGSLRIYGRHASATMPSKRVLAVREKEDAAGLEGLETYRNFAELVAALKCDILEFLIGARRARKSVVGYGAPAKGNTLLNYLGIGRDFIEFTVDLNPHKQGYALPGTRIPIRAPEAIFAARPSYVLILPWNLKDEIMAQLSDIKSWNGKFVLPIPALTVV